MRNTNMWLEAFRISKHIWLSKPQSNFSYQDGTLLGDGWANVSSNVEFMNLHIYVSF